MAITSKTKTTSNKIRMGSANLNILSQNPGQGFGVVETSMVVELEVFGGASAVVELEVSFPRFSIIQLTISSVIFFELEVLLARPLIIQLKISSPIVVELKVPFFRVSTRSWSTSASSLIGLGVVVVVALVTGATELEGVVGAKLNNLS